MHLVFRLSDDPLRVFDDAGDRAGRRIGEAAVGGARASFYIREISGPLCSVGAQLRPGAAEALFGVHADELAGHHTPLADLWGTSVSGLRGQLAEARALEQRLALFEAMLVARLSRVRGLHPAVAQALERMATVTSVHEVVRRSGFSHRTFISLFCRSVGLPPKLYSRVRRFQRALRRVSESERVPWIDVAAVAGYSDQSHFNREFREFVGVSPTEYRRTSPRLPHHLPVDSRR
jgi:AraC-like DNA-binding protein